MGLKAGRVSPAVIAAVVALLAAVAVVVVLVTGSSRRAPASVHPGDPQAMLEEDVNLMSHPARTLQIMRSLGVDVVRLSVAWNTIAPDATAHKPPPGFDGADPAAYPETGWAPYDRIVRDAKADGIEVDFLLTGGAPLWATGPGAPASERSSGAWEPSPSAYGAFVNAVGRRYSGRYVPPGASAPLPPVRFWEIWNEPNWGPSLQPQLALDPVRIVAAARYRRLMDAAWGALQGTGHHGDTIVIGSLSPRGVVVPPQSALAAAVDVSSPLGFTRTLYCVDSSLRPLRGGAAAQAGCPATDAGSRRFAEEHPALFEASGFGIHPYPIDLPPTEADPSGPGSVEFSQIPQLESTLDGARRAYGSHAAMSVYNTEFGYITHPPNANAGLPSPATAARYLNWAEYLTWRNPRLATTMQYLLYDPPPGPSVYGAGGFATALVFANGKPKATFYAYRMPIFLPSTRTRRGGALEVWGGVRPAHDAYLDTRQRQFAQIQFRPAAGGAFRTLRSVPITDIRGYFDVRVNVPASGWVRLQWSYPTGDRRLRDPLTPGQTTIYSRVVAVSVS